MTDPLGLAGFADHILSLIVPMGVVAAVALAVILLVFGAARR